MRRSILSACVCLVTIMPLQVPAADDLDSAWGALHGLRINEARQLFQEHLERRPQDPEALRGRILSAYFDLDHPLEVDMVRAYVEADAVSPYLPAVFEYIASTMEDWSESNELIEQISETLIKHGSGALRYMGYRIETSHLEKTALKWPKDRLETLGACPGGWLIGPFDNGTNIAAYRDLPLESEPLDTLARAIGKLGFRCSWTWLPADRFGTLFPSKAAENEAETASLFRTFFSLPDSMEVILLLGGAFSGRVAIDGRQVLDDPIYRNAVQREGVRIALPAGNHEITQVVCHGDASAVFHLHLLDANYEPISGLTWLRYADSVAGAPSEATPAHPIFDPYEAMLDSRPPRPDDRYWWAMLKTYNGFGQEVIEEFERLAAADELTLLETWILTRALYRNDEATKATEYLGVIRQAVSTPLTDWNWISATAESYQAQINDCIRLDSVYPGRTAIEAILALKPALERDIPGVFASLEEIEAKYPKYTSLTTLKSTYYQRLLNDPESAYEEFLKACEKGSDKRTKMLESSGHLQGLSRWDEAIKQTEAAIDIYSHTDGLIRSLVNTHLQRQTAGDVIPVLDSLIRAYPSNIELYSLIHAAYQRTGELDKARATLEAIHRVKPAAVRPYVEIDSLHNSVPYDEIFDSYDVMALWDREPSEQERGPGNHWYLLDSRQEIVFDAGVVHSDVHWATVLLDRDAVEQAQEMSLAFDNSQWYNKLLTARRLRKGQPPLAGEVDGGSVVFRDLQPGDAVEIHYRTWHARSGDLWMEYWNTYQVYADSYQRHWEFTVLTERDDVAYSMVAPAEEPVVSERHGYRKLTWQGDNYPAMNVDCAMAPPAEDLLGKVFVSTISEWDDIRRWYAAISEAILDHNPRSTQLAREITAGLESDGDKLRSLYDYVVQEIPYQVFQFDYDASIPHGPDQVLVNRWGDCKDKGHLLVAMLREAGMDAWPVLTMSRSEGTHLPLPQFAFDHLVAACVVDGDTLYVDVTDVPFPPDCSITSDFQGQPYLLITSTEAGNLKRLRGADPAGSRWFFSLNLKPRDEEAFDMEYQCEYHNLEAGYRRYNLRGVTRSELREQTESNYSTSWAVTVTVDSIQQAEVEASDSVFIENIFGRIDLNVQRFGATTIVSMPDWSFVSKGLVPALVKDGRRDYPVDLRGFVGRFEKTLVVDVPESYGQPQLADPVRFSDSLLSFESRSKWDEATRTLRRTHVMEVQDGFCPHETFEAFARKVMGAFDAPLLFSQ